MEANAPYLSSQPTRAVTSAIKVHAARRIIPNVANG